MFMIFNPYEYFAIFNQTCRNFVQLLSRLFLILCSVIQRLFFKVKTFREGQEKGNLIFSSSLLAIFTFSSHRIDSYLPPCLLKRCGDLLADFSHWASVHESTVDKGFAVERCFFARWPRLVGNLHFPSRAIV
jgi:hypothetical protein